MFLVGYDFHSKRHEEVKKMSRQFQPYLKKSSKKTVSTSIAAMLVLPLFISACSQTQTFSVKDGDASATATYSSDGRSGTVKVTGKDGKDAATMTMGADAKYPSEIPVAQYPGSSISLSMDQSGMSTGAEVKSVSLESSDSAEKIQSYYKSWMTSNGWKIIGESLVSGTGSLTGELANKNLSVLVMPGNQGGKAAIQIMFSTSK